MPVARRLQQSIQPFKAPLAPRTWLAAGGLTALVLVPVQPALAQRVVPKIGSICPLGYVDLFNGSCSTLGLMTYTLRPTEGEACLEGWMNVGGGYCRKK
jgi:hypothetical protein